VPDTAPSGTLHAYRPGRFLSREYETLSNRLSQDRGDGYHHASNCRYGIGRLTAFARVGRRLLTESRSKPLFWRQRQSHGQKVVHGSRNAMVAAKIDFCHDLQGLPGERHSFTMIFEKQSQNGS
jgi:hypothetical protein